MERLPSLWGAIPSLNAVCSDGLREAGLAAQVRSSGWALTHPRATASSRISGSTGEDSDAVIRRLFALAASLLDLPRELPARYVCVTHLLVLYVFPTSPDRELPRPFQGSYAPEIALTPVPGAGRLPFHPDSGDSTVPFTYRRRRRGR